MKILTIHADFIEFQPLTKAIESAEETETGEAKKKRIEECLVVFTSVEKRDTPEVVEDAGILCNPDKPFDFAAACSKIINSKLARDNLVAKGLKRAKDFSWTDAAKKTLKVIESAYSSTKEPPIF